MVVIIYAFMILLMYFLAGVNKARNFSQTVSGLKNMFFLKNLPNLFYQLAIFLVIVLEIVAPLVILYSLQTNLHTNRLHTYILKILIIIKIYIQININSTYKSI